MIKKRKIKIGLEATYIIKLMLYTVLGAQWLFIEHGSRSQLAFPLGLIIGILFAHNERFQIDRKIEYAVLLVAMLIGYFSQIGLIITL